MLRTSAKVEAMPTAPQDGALDHLHRGQSNDCYWHGLFGGIYISHMRLATYEHLIAAEDAADRAARAAGRADDGVRVEDVDLDGVPEVVLATDGQVVAVKPSEGAGIGAWDVRAVRHALAAVMRRRPEAAHEILLAHERKLAERGGAAPAETGGVGSIHEMVSTKEPGLAGRLHYDAYERRSGLVHLFAPGTDAGGLRPADASSAETSWPVVPVEATGTAEGQLGAARPPRPGPHEAAPSPSGSSNDRGRRRPGTPTLALEVRVENRGAGPLEATLAVELGDDVLGAVATRPLLRDRRERIPHDGACSRASLTGFARQRVHRPRIGHAGDAGGRRGWAPIDTISNSEAGFERVYQGSALVFSWPLVLAAGGATTVRVEHAVTTTRDRAVEEGL